jgi:hypothetical protein
MGLLLYRSDEMYSSTDLIRKSKKIFTKVLENKIDKAIILRDGKPTFLLMEFKKYEKIMADYERLKANEHKKIIKPVTIEKVKTIEPFEPKKPIEEPKPEETTDSVKQQRLLMIKKAREARAKVLEEEASKRDNEDLKEELRLQNELNKVKEQKDRELKEFWD